VAKLLIEEGSDAGGSWATGHPPTTDLAQASRPKSSPKGQTDLPIDQVDKCDALALQVAGGFVSVAAGGEYLAASQQLDPFTSIGLHMTKGGRRLRRGQLSQQVLDGQITVCCDERRRSDIAGEGGGLGAGSLAFERRSHTARPTQDLFGQKPPFAADTVTRQTSTQQAVDMLWMNPKQAGHVARCEERVTSVQFSACKTRARSLHERANTL